MNNAQFKLLADLKARDAAGELELCARYNRIAKEILEDRLSILGPNNVLEYRLKAEAIHAGNEYWRCLKALNELETPGAPEVALAK